MFPADPSDDFPGKSAASDPSPPPPPVLHHGRPLRLSPLFKLPGCFVDQRPIYVDSYGGSLSGSKKRDYFLSEHLDLCSSAVLMQLPKPGDGHAPPPQQGDPRPPPEDGEARRRPLDRLPPGNTFMGGCPLGSCRHFLSFPESLTPIFFSPRPRNIRESSLAAA